MISTDVCVVKGERRAMWFYVVWTFAAVPSAGEDSEVCEWCIRSDFRFFTPLRYVQNDKRNRALRSEGQNRQA